MNKERVLVGPQIGNLVEVRGRRWIVGDVIPGGTTLVELTSVEDGRFDEKLTIAWQVETDARVLESGSLPDLAGEFDPPEKLAAFLDAVAWGAVATADAATLQAPFRSGVAVENYQLEPVARALTAPRVNLLLADDVGLGKTIEAGLVMQELLLRQRARRIMIVCPAGLTIKWQQEMAEKFGIRFEIVNAEKCKELRLSHGSAANPFEVYPRIIVSLPWLRGPRAQRLLREVLPEDGPTTRRIFDLLVLDEAHHVAPAAPQQRYAVDSKQTKLIQWLAPHFEHRLFLSATPHNGYPESFTALLELIDDQRFARGVPPDETSRSEVVVRRLKSDIVDETGQRKFAERANVAPLEVDYSDAERDVHRMLAEFAQARRDRLGRRKSTDLVTLLLKKRLFSSPEAFARTIGVLSDGYEKRRDEFDDDEFDDYDDGELSDDEMLDFENTTLVRASASRTEPSERELSLLRDMRQWAANNTANPDSKARKLLEYLEAVCRPDGRHWTPARVVVFTEYRDTQTWLHTQLLQQGMETERIGLLHGGLNSVEREALRQEFQSTPDDKDSKVRILLATDAASEGIDLHWHCHRMVNFDIPFNPNKLEQRIGRIDRYGQTQNPEIRHFVSTGWENAADTFAGDLEFLSRVARKVAQIQVDLGAVNAVLSQSVQRRMLGERIDVDVELAVRQPRGRGKVPSDADVSSQVRRLREQLDQTRDRLNLTPAAVERVVQTALPLARQSALMPVTEDPYVPADPEYPADAPLFEVPALTGPWVRATTGLPHPLRPERQRPVTFDPLVAKHRREDVVYAHLKHPLVSMSAGLLRAAVTNPQINLARVTAIASDDPKLESTLLGAYARFVIVGADGIRLHEEVLHAGGWLRDGGFVRERSVNRLDDLLRPALAKGKPVPPHVRDRLVHSWPDVKPNLLRALEVRSQTRHESLMATVEKRRLSDAARIEANLDRFAHSLKQALGLVAAPAPVDEDGYLQPMLDLSQLIDPNEKKQAEADRENWDARLKGLDAQRATELAKIDHRYSDLKQLMFPVAVVAVVPQREVVR